jgi:hypothetical protein
LEDETDEHAVNLQWHLRNSLFEFPFQLLENNYTSLSFNKHLLEIYEIAKNREQVKCLEPEVLWEELTTLSDRYRNKKTESHDSIYGHLLVKSLSKKQNGEKIKHRVIKYLSQETDVNYYLEDYLVELAGNLKLVEAVPYLFRILIDSAPIHIVRETCTKSLGQIGTPGVVEEIGALYQSDRELITALAGIIEYIPYDYSEEMAIQLLKGETDPDAITFLAASLCCIFSIKSGEMIIDIIEKKQYNPTIMRLLDYLIPVYVYHNKAIDNLAELEKISCKFRDESWEANPTVKLAESLKDMMAQKAKKDKELDTFKPEKPGDYSQKREKVIPISLIPSKKRHKDKKKRKKKKNKK